MPAPYDGDKVTMKQAQVGKPLGRRGEATHSQIQLAAVEKFCKLQRAARAYIEFDIWSLLSDRRGEGSRKTDRRSVIHGDGEAALRCFRIERGSAIERRMEVLQRCPDGTDKPFGIGRGRHAFRSSHEQIVVQRAS
jgi:hypothetical protein